MCPLSYLILLCHDSFYALLTCFIILLYIWMYTKYIALFCNLPFVLNSVIWSSATLTHGGLVHLFSFFFIHLFTCAYIVWVISWPCPLLPSPTQFQAGPVLLLSLILLKKRHKHNKEDKAFLLVKDSYTERFLALLPCTNVLQPKLIHL
jgi:hypothetical protein